MTTAKTLLTADEFLAMPDDGRNYELVRGELVEMPPPGFMHEFIVAQFIMSFGNFVLPRNLGIVTGGPGIFIEQDPDTVRAPDCAFISHERIIMPLPDRGYVFGLIPDLAVEVVSPDYSVAQARVRARMWLESGVRLALAAHIATQEIITYRDDGAVQSCGMGDEFNCDPALPGFTCPVADIFDHP